MVQSNRRKPQTFPSSTVYLTYFLISKSLRKEFDWSSFGKSLLLGNSTVARRAGYCVRNVAHRAHSTQISCTNA